MKLSIFVGQSYRHHLGLSLPSRYGNLPVEGPNLSADKVLHGKHKELSPLVPLN